MENDIHKKMKIKPGMTALAINAPPDYPKAEELIWQLEGRELVDFIHLFLESKVEFENLFSSTAIRHKSNGLFWVSYPKSQGKNKPDINRDHLWDLLIPQGFHPVSQIALDDKWSAIRVKINEEGTKYDRPNRKK